MTNVEHPQHRRAFVGRTREIEQFRIALEHMLSEYQQIHEWVAEVGTQFDSGAAPRDASYPRCFVLHGVGGMGKTWLTWRLLEVVQQDFMPLFERVYIDVSTRPEVETERDLLMRIARALDAKSFDMSTFFSMIKRGTEMEARVAGYQAENREEWERSLEVVAKTVAGATNVATQVFAGPALGSTAESVVERGVKLTGRGVHSITRKALEVFAQRMQEQGTLTQDEAEILADPDDALARQLIDCLKQIANDTPLVIALDTLETIVPLEPFIRDSLIARCENDSIIFIIAGRHDVSRERSVDMDDYHARHKGFADILSSPPVVVDLKQFAAPEIHDYLVERASGEGASWQVDDALVEAIQVTSGGVPLAVELAVDAALRLAPEDFQRSFALTPRFHLLLPGERIAEITDRFLRYCLDHTDDLDKVRALSVLRKGAPEGALRAVWNLPPEVSVRDARASLAARYAFMRGGELHDEVQRFVRRQLLTDPSVEETRRALAENALKYYERGWQREADADPDLAERIDDERYREVTLDLLNTYLWLQDGRAIEFLYKRWVESYPFSRSFCRRLLELVEEFSDLEGFFRKRERNHLNLLQQLTHSSSGSSFLDEWLARRSHPTRVETNRFGLEASTRSDDTETLDRLRRVQAVGENAQWWEPIHMSVLRLIIGQQLHKQEQQKQALLLMSQAATDAETLSGQQTLRAKIVDLCENLGKALGYRKAPIDNGLEPLAVPEAVRAYRLAVLLDPAKGDAHRRLGRLYEKLGDHGEAQMSFVRATDVNPRNADNWVALGDFQLSVAKFEEAIAAYNKAFEINPRDVRAWVGLGNLHSARAEYEEAIAAYNKALEINPRTALAWVGLSDVYFDRAEYEEAIAACDKVLEIYPNECVFHRNRARVFMFAERWGEADSDVSFAERQQPTNPYTYARRGQLLFAKGDYDQAIDKYVQASAMHGDSTEFNFDIALPLLARGDVHQALHKISERLSSVEGPPTDLPEALAWFRWLQGRSPELLGVSQAIELLQDASSE